MMRTLILVLIIFAFAIGCSNGRGQESPDSGSPDSLKMAISDFKTDSLGCLGLRSKVNIDFIFGKGEIKGKSEKELISLIGNPNDSVSANGFRNLRYYFGRACFNGTPIDSVESCWSNFRIELNSGKVSAVDFVCQ
jgi:hypothetical protein